MQKKDFKEILVKNKFYLLLSIFFLVVNCSLTGKSSFWSDSEKIELQKKIKITEVFVEEKDIGEEFNSNIKIVLKNEYNNENFINNLNNNGQLNYNGDLSKVSKFKFPKIKDFNKYEPSISFDDKNIIFFGKKGEILKFNETSKLIWKNNYYTKREKKLDPILFFASNKDTLIVADNIAKYYAVNIKTGELKWTKHNTSSFNSQIKIYKDKFFIVDAQNILRCFSIKDGNELWNIKTDQSLIKSQKKLSLIIIGANIFFNNSIGDISAVSINDEKLIWQVPTQNNNIYEDSFFLKTSDLVSDKKSILFSNNKNELYSLDSSTGILNWKQKVSASIRPTLIDNLIFTVSEKGFFIIIDKNNGNLIRATNVFNQIKNKKNKIKPVGFVVGKNNIYLTTNHGRLIIADIKSGKTLDVLKIDNEKISRPFILSKNLFIIKQNSILRLN